MTYVYHRVPSDLKGHILRPLNDWKEIEPELYASKVAKYVGREHVMEQRIDSLGCIWNDVLFLQPIHPAKINAALTSLGHPLKGREYYQIPLEILESSHTTLWLWEHNGAANKAPNCFLPCTDEELAKHQELREVTLRYYEEQYSLGKSPLLYYMVPHVLYRGVLDTRQLEIITI